jgi:hypothetical protein
MQACPLHHELVGTTWKTANQQVVAANGYSGTMLGILSVEMRGLVIVEIHCDYDAVEEADLGHIVIMDYDPD